MARKTGILPNSGSRNRFELSRRESPAAMPGFLLGRKCLGLEHFSPPERSRWGPAFSPAAAECGRNNRKAPHAHSREEPRRHTDPGAPRSCSHGPGRCRAYRRCRRRFSDPDRTSFRNPASVTPLGRQQERMHRLQGKLSVRLLEDGPDVDDGVGVLSLCRVFQNRGGR